RRPSRRCRSATPGTPPGPSGPPAPGAPSPWPPGQRAPTAGPDGSGTDRRTARQGTGDAGVQRGRRAPSPPRVDGYIALPRPAVPDPAETNPASRNPRPPHWRSRIQGRLLSSLLALQPRATYTENLTRSIRHRPG